MSSTPLHPPSPALFAQKGFISKDISSIRAWFCVDFGGERCYSGTLCWGVANAGQMLNIFYQVHLDLT